MLSIDHIILGLISLEPSSGYDMKLELEKGITGMLSSLSFGSIYPHLKNLEQQGFIEILQHKNGGRQKRLYELTADGWDALAEWLEEPTEYPLPIRDPLLLKMLFWGATGLDRSILRERLQQRQTESTDLLVYMMERQRDGQAFIDEYAELFFHYMQLKIEAELDWLHAAIAQLSEPEQTPPQDPRWLSMLQKARRVKASIAGNTTTDPD